jgi:peptide/nickel transport system permease protein
MTPTSLADTAPETTGAASVAAASASRRRAARIRSVGRTIVGAAITLWGTATVAFFAQLALPGDRATTIFNIRAGQMEQRTPEELAPINDAYGLLDPVWRQYLDYMKGLVTGDLGLSYQQFRPVTDIIGEQLPATFALSITAIALAWVIMLIWVPLTAGRSRRVRALGSLADTTAAGLPHYWIGILLLVVFAATLGWFPVISGSQPAGLFLPALTLAIPLAGFLGQSTRTAFENTLRQPFIIPARMRGMSDSQARIRHVLRHSILPAITLSGWALGATMSGAVVVESVYSRQGIGTVLINAVNSQDLPIVTGAVVLIAAFYVIANVLVDIVYTLVDPRMEKNS